MEMAEEQLAEGWRSDERMSKDWKPTGKKQEKTESERQDMCSEV